MIPTNHEYFGYQLDLFAKAHAGVESALEGVFEHEMRLLAKRFPTRRIEMHSGMGTTQITIKKRRPARNAYDEWNYYGAAGTSYRDWPESVGIPAPDLWSAIRLYEDEVSDGKDPGVGVIIYENGKRIKGLAAGGKV